MKNDTPPSSLSQDAREHIFAWLRSLDADMPHMLQVNRLALEIFDGTAPLHQEGAAARKLLEAAALLHDVGFTVEEKSHHKHSRDLILKQGIPNFDKQEIRAVACLARYHRKAAPSLKHDLFAKLDPPLQRTVERLAAILRVADGLDRSHQSRVRVIRCEVAPDETVLHLESAGDIGTELYGFEKKKDYFESLFGRTLRLEFEEAA